MGSRSDAHDLVLWMSQVPSLDRHAVRALTGFLGQDAADVARLLYTAPESGVGELCGSLWQEQRAGRMRSAILAARRRDPGRLARDLHRQGIRFTYPGERGFPERLRHIPDPPFALYIRGSLPSLARPAVAISGSRRPSEYGRGQAAAFGRTLSEAGIQTVTGLSGGVERIFTGTALSAGGRVLGIMGCSLEYYWPRESQELWQQLERCGGLLSEYPPGTRPRGALYPPRNRLLSGLADAVLLIEAQAGNGSLHLVDAALEQGREVLCVPGRISEERSRICNTLIAQGALPALSPIQVADFLTQLGGRSS